MSPISITFMAPGFTEVSHILKMYYILKNLIYFGKSKKAKCLHIKFTKRKVLSQDMHF